MIEGMANNLVDKFTKEQLINERQKEHYTYAFILIVEKIITIGTICIIGFITNEFIHTILFLVFFLTLRKRTGGYHAKTFLQCYFGTIISYIIVSRISWIGAEYPHLILIVLTIAICMIEIIGTVNHPNMHMSIAELSEAKKIARIIVLLEGSIILFLVCIGANWVAINYMSMAIILCATLLCIAKIIKQEEGKQV